MQPSVRSARRFDVLAGTDASSGQVARRRL